MSMRLSGGQGSILGFRRCLCENQGANLVPALLSGRVAVGTVGGTVADASVTVSPASQSHPIAEGTILVRGGEGNSSGPFPNRDCRRPPGGIEQVHTARPEFTHTIGLSSNHVLETTGQVMDFELFTGNSAGLHPRVPVTGARDVPARDRSPLKSGCVGRRGKPATGAQGQVPDSPRRVGARRMTEAWLRRPARETGDRRSRSGPGQPSARWRPPNDWVAGV